MQLLSLFDIHVYIPDLDRRQDIDDVRRNRSGNISRLSVTAAADLPHWKELKLAQCVVELKIMER